jgi:hypothetical protein
MLLWLARGLPSQVLRDRSSLVAKERPIQHHLDPSSRPLGIRASSLARGPERGSLTYPIPEIIPESLQLPI